MTRILTIAAVLGLSFGAQAAELPNLADEPVQTEVAPGSAVAPLDASHLAVPRFVMAQKGLPVPELAPDVPSAAATSAVFAFDAGGPRLPGYEPEIATGSTEPRQ